MKKVNQAKRGFGRSQRGTVITETPVAIGLITAVTVPLVIFATNLAFQLIYQSEVAHIANEAARVADENRFWLGLPRPGNEGQVSNAALEKARQAAVSMCARIGLPGASATASVQQEGDVDLTVVNLNVNAIARIPFRLQAFGFDFARLFPGNISARGVSAHARVQPYAVMHFDCPVAPNNQPNGIVHAPGDGPPQNRGVAVLPAYGFWHHVPPDHGRLGPYGRLGGFQGTADIQRVTQFAAFNLAGFTPRRDLLRVAKLEANVLPPTGKTIFTLQAPAPQGVTLPGEYLTTGFLQPESYSRR